MIETSVRILKDNESYKDFNLLGCRDGAISEKWWWNIKTTQDLYFMGMIIHIERFYEN